MDVFLAELLAADFPPITEAGRLKVYDMVWNYSKELMTWPTLLITALIALKKDVFVRSGNASTWPLVTGLLLFAVSVAAGIVVMGMVSGGLVQDAAKGTISGPSPQSKIAALTQFLAFGAGSLCFVGYAVYLACKHRRPLSKDASGVLDNH
ncbi:MAG TPA: hypothetical protein VD994_18215 [Prosthecobacter sp.]|nr:hypothetical protein [Prosthecobacter sp.]